ncbi:MAG: lyase family protein, partial [Microgenomates group bacterium]
MKQEVKFQAPESSHLHESPLRRRYGSDEMKKIWDPQNLWLKVRDVWVANARAQKGAGLVRPAELRDLIKHRSEIDIDDIERREMDRTYRDEVTGESKYTGHDVIAAIAEFGERATVGSRIIHQGMTSEDALSNAEMGLIHESFDLLERRIVDVLARFAGHIDNYKDMVCMGYTHLQAAEPTTVGYRMARYAQDFLNDLHLIQTVRPLLKTKGMKGTVGTSASYSALLEGTGLTVEDFEKQVMEELGLEAVLISAQTYPRKFTYLAMTMLASVGQSAHQFATDTKLLQFSDVNQAAEARDKEDLGSSYM